MTEAEYRRINELLAVRLGIGALADAMLAAPSKWRNLEGFFCSPPAFRYAKRAGFRGLP
jgi:hypothetical protein